MKSLREGLSERMEIYGNKRLKQLERIYLTSQLISGSDPHNVVLPSELRHWAHLLSSTILSTVGNRHWTIFLPSVGSLVVIITPGRAWMVIIKFLFLSFTFTNRPWKQDLGHSFSVTRWRWENYAMACRKSLTISLGCPRRTSFNLHQNPVEGRQSSPLLPLHSSFPSLFL